MTHTLQRCVAVSEGGCALSAAGGFSFSPSIAGGQADDGRYRLRVDLFEVEQHDLPIERLQ